MKPVISIIIPSYRRPALLARCIAALRDQRFPRNLYEIIVVSDGPDASTAAIASSFPGRPLVRYHALRQKRGPAAARNAGWQMAEGRLILFTDDDCIPARFWIDAFWNAWCRHLSGPVAFTGQVLVPCPPVPTDYEKNISWLEQAEFVTANCACTKTALQLVGGFDEAFTLAWREDSDLQFRLLQQGIPIRFIQQAVVTHPVRKAVWGISLKEQKKTMYNALLYKKHPYLFRTRIKRHPFWNYYGMTLLAFLGLLSAVAGLIHVVILAFSGWFVLLIAFIAKRLKGTSHSLDHVAEMVITSILIPFLAVYWTLYGSYKFKTRLL